MNVIRRFNVEIVSIKRLMSENHESRKLSLLAVIHGTLINLIRL